MGCEGELCVCVCVGVRGEPQITQYPKNTIQSLSEVGGRSSLLTSVSDASETRQSFVKNSLTTNNEHATVTADHFPVTQFVFGLILFPPDGR